MRSDITAACLRSTHVSTVPNIFLPTPESFVPLLAALLRCFVP